MACVFIILLEVEGAYCIASQWGTIVVLIQVY